MSYDTKHFTYKILPIMRTSSYSCDKCYSQYSPLNLKRVHGFYKNKDIPVSYLYKCDIQDFYWMEPMCVEHLREWTFRYDKIIFKKIYTSTWIIQRFWRKYYYSPPSDEIPKGGILYRQAQNDFRDKMKLQ